MKEKSFEAKRRQIKSKWVLSESTKENVKEILLIVAFSSIFPMIYLLGRFVKDLLSA